MDSKQGTGARPPQSPKAAIEQAGGKAGCCGTAGQKEQADRTTLPGQRETGCCGGNARSDAARRNGGCRP